MELILGIIGILLSGIFVIIFILDFWYKRKEDRKKKRKELLGPLYDDVEKKKDLIKNYKKSPLYVLENLRPLSMETRILLLNLQRFVKNFQKLER